MNIIYNKIKKAPTKSKGKLHRLKRLILSGYYWTLSHSYNTPGLGIQKSLVKLALKLRLAGAARTPGYQQLVTLPLDSVRYFEFEFMWNAVMLIKPKGNYLDVSSPRMLPLLLLEHHTELSATLVNPDVSDLSATQELFGFIDVVRHCVFKNALIEDVGISPATFDLITCMSVVEHIPFFGDRDAIEKMWTLLKPGGTLLISVPCARTAFEEYIDFDDYGLQATKKGPFFFGQRFYDDNLLQERIFSVTGSPRKMRIYGEKVPGFLISNREEKCNNQDYPVWREPYLMGQHFAYFDAIDRLPGWGVVAMELYKPI